MANRTIKQSVPILQEHRKILLRRIEHLSLLITQIKDEITSMGEQLSKQDNNRLQKSAMKLENIRQDLAYYINKQEDIEQQQKEIDDA